MNKCQDISRDLSALVDGELTPDRQAEVIEHVDACSTCQARIAVLQKIASGVGAIPPVQPPARFLQDVRRQIRQQPAITSTPWLDRLFRPIWLKVPIEAVAVVLLVLGVMALIRPESQSLKPSHAKLVPQPDASQRPAITAPPITARILKEEAIPADQAAMDHAAGRVAQVQHLPVAPSIPTEQPALADSAVNAAIRPDLPETIVVKAESLVAVRLRAEQLALSLEGRVEASVATNVMLVYLPQSKVDTFCAQMPAVRKTKGYASFHYAAPAPSTEAVQPLAKTSAPERTLSGRAELSRQVTGGKIAAVPVGTPKDPLVELKVILETNGAK